MDVQVHLGQQLVDLAVRFTRQTNKLIVGICGPALRNLKIRVTPLRNHL
jgi:hypothetical protein